MVMRSVVIKLQGLEFPERDGCQGETEPCDHGPLPSPLVPSVYLYEN